MSQPRWVPVAPFLMLLWLSGINSLPQSDTVSVRLHEKINNSIIRSTYELFVVPDHAELI